VAFDLERFVEAQRPVFGDVAAELRAGRKVTHWMWFVFPQLKGLGMSDMANVYGLAGKAEAAAYLSHPILGPRLIECTTIVNAIERRSAVEIFGGVDAMKFRSCMTLFELVAPRGSPFPQAIEKYFGGQRDERTLSLTRAR
jgi:uncharacterized protein (DUF1810 family)